MLVYRASQGRRVRSVHGGPRQYHDIEIAQTMAPEPEAFPNLTFDAISVCGVTNSLL